MVSERVIRSFIIQLEKHAWEWMKSQTEKMGTKDTQETCIQIPTPKTKQQHNLHFHAKGFHLKFGLVGTATI